MTCASNKLAFVKAPLPDFITDWAKQMNIELIPSRQQEIYELIFENEKLQLNWLGKENFLPLFAEPPQIHRIMSTNLLSKAIGKKTQVVHDMTAGLGLDAMTLAAMGKTVHCFERCAPIALLCFDGIRRSPAVMKDRIKLNFVDSLEWLRDTHSDFDAVYIDAMFAHRKKTAKSAKAMQIVRALAGDDDDAQILFNLALNARAKRVVIKHTDTAAVFKDNPPAQYQGKTVRFDVYIPIKQ